MSPRSIKRQQETDHAQVYFSFRDKVFLVVAQAKMGVGTAEVGQPVTISDVDFESRVGDIIIQFLESFRTNVYSPNTARRLSDEEYRAFRRRHLNVTVERIPSGDIILTPMHHSKGGYGGSHDERIVIPKDGVPTRLPSALREAFSLAT